MPIDAENTCGLCGATEASCRCEAKPPVRSSELVRRQIDNHPSLSPRERHNIKRALDAGEAYGYGNIMAWLATEWAVKLRDESGLPESVAIEAVSNRTPYALPPNDKAQRRRE